jgi:hypothetical protein
LINIGKLTLANIFSGLCRLSTQEVPGDGPGGGGT